MNTDILKIDRWSIYERAWTIKKCRIYLETREIPPEYYYICAECLISDIIYEHAYCYNCHLAFPKNPTMDCWCSFCRILK